MNPNDERAAIRGGHATLKGAMGAYRRRQDAADRILARHGFPATVQTPQPDPSPDTPKPPPDYGGGVRGVTPTSKPTLNDIMRAISRGRER